MLYGLTLTDAQDVPLWTVDPVNAGTGGGAASAGMGMGSNTVALTPGASTAQAGAVVFPASVLAMGLTVWVTETFGTSQGLTQIGIGTLEHPDCWGVLTELTADTQTHAGVFLGYSGQPMPGDGTVTLTAYGGHFDGTGAVYLTGHFATFHPSHALGLTWTPPGPPSPEPPAPQPYATETTPGVVELIDATEVLQGTDLTRAVTIGRLVSRTSTETRVGLVELATTAEVTAGTNDTTVVTPLKLAQRIAALPAAPLASETVAGLVELATSAEVTTGTDATRAVTPAALAAKVPAGTALSVVRYGSSGQTLESAPGVLTTDNANQLVLGSNVSGLGVGTPLVIEQDLSTQVVVTAGAVTGTSAPSGVLLRASRGSLAVPQPLQAGDLAGFVRWGGYSGTWQNYLAAVEALATETWSGSARGTRLSLSTTLTGTTTRAERLQLDGAGNLTTWDTGKVGLGTPLTATLGSGAAYMTLNVKGSQLFTGQSSVQERPQALIGSTWSVSTDATRQGRLTLAVYDSVAARELIRMEADGSTSKLSFFAAAAVAKPTVTGSRGGNAALASALSALASLGLVTDSSTA